MLFKKIAIAAISLSFFGGFASVGLGTTEAGAATKGVKFEQRFKYFKVRGKTSLEIFRDFQKKSPIKGVGNHQATLGVASIKLTPNVEFGEKNGRCKVIKSKVTVDVVIHLPRWANYRRANKFAKLSWDKLFEDIKTHELVHAKIAKDFGTQIQNKIESLGSRSSCQSLERVVSRNSQRLLNKHDRAQRKFDRREQKKMIRARRKARL
ncbi:MAG: DUF922 domain-containing protein [Hyphomicrobiales bacterium]